MADQTLMCGICEQPAAVLVEIVTQADLAVAPGQHYSVCPTCLSTAEFEYTVLDVDTAGKGTWLQPTDLARTRELATDPTILANRGGPVWCAVCQDSEAPAQATLVVMPADDLRLCIAESVHVICDGCYEDSPPEIRTGRVLARLPVLDGDVPVPPDGALAYRSDTGVAVAVTPAR